MKRRNFIVASIFAGAAIGSARAGSNDQADGDSSTVVDRFFAAYSARRLDICMDCFSQRGDVFAYGSAVGEKRIGLEAICLQLQQDWAQSEETQLQVAWRKVDHAAPISWIAADIVGSTKVSGSKLSIEARATFVLRQESQAWKIVQMHFSIPTR
jgi:ketosteroid isomerase-like protein